MRIILIIFAMALLGAGNALAQTEGKLLEGAKNASLIILTSNSENDKCKISKSEIKDTFIFPISSTKLNVWDALKNMEVVKDIYISIIINTIETTDLCIYTIRVKSNIRTANDAKIPFNNKEARTEIVFFEDMLFGYSAYNNYADVIKKGVGQLTKSFATLYNMDNK